MSVEPSTTGKVADQEPEFRSTHWSLVIRAGQFGAEGAEKALEELCRRYWYPIYAYARRQGKSPEDSQDLTQGYFATVIEKGYLKTADRERGKFRTFLLTSFKGFAANQWNRDHAWKRGGRSEHFSLDTSGAEEVYQLESTSDVSPEKVFDRKWALALIDRAYERLADEYRRAGKADRYERLKPFILDDPEPNEYEGLAKTLQLSASGLRSAVMRLRIRYQELFRDEIADTVSDNQTLEDEIQHLLVSLSS